MKSMRVVIVDDHALMRDGIASLLDEQPDFEVVGEVGSLAAAVEVVRATEPELVLMDYSLPDGTGLDATKEILALYPQTKIVILTVHEEDDLLFAAIRSGARGYLLKSISAREMLARLRGLAEGEAAILPEQTQRILAEFARTTVPQAAAEEEASALSERELEVLRLLAEGASNQEIGVQLHISVHTVKNHVHHILEKLNIGNRHEAVALATKRGLLPDSRD